MSALSRRKLGLALIIAGTALLVGALSLFAWTRWDEARANDSVSEVMEQLEPLVGSVEAEGDDPLPRVLVGQNYYIGYVEMPALDLRLPVMTTWSYEQLSVAPCRYYGSVATDNLVVAGFNYSGHFARLDELVAGDEVRLVAMDGTEYDYEVAEVDALQNASPDELTSGEFDLTLFTCSYGGGSNIVVRCDRAR